MKIPRDINGEQILKKLEKIGYEKTKQTGSHMKLTKKFSIGEHNITIPNHNPIKIGILNSIILKSYSKTTVLPVKINKI